MPALREELGAAGFAGVRSYVQSGNLVLDSELAPAAVAGAIHDLIADRFELTIPVLTRTAEELAAVVAADPLRGVATDPRRYQVSFLSAEPDPAALARLGALAEPPEQLVHIGRELYAWHPHGVARSKLWNALASKGALADVIATARNWTTATTLLEMASA